MTSNLDQLFRSSRSSLTADEVSVTTVAKKGCKSKRQNSESEGDEAPVTTATDKGCKGVREFI